MKTLFFLIVLVLSNLSFSQTGNVGINTVNPLANLDINGNLRVRNIQKRTSNLPIDSILVSDGKGYIEHISKADIGSSSNYSYVSGTGSDNLITTSILSSNWTKIPFNYKTIDEHNDFDISNATFTAPKNGIYHVHVQIQTSSLLSADILGVGIFVKKTGNTPELVAEESYVNISVLGISTSPTTRKTECILKLNAGDEVYFGTKANIVSLQLFGGTASFFTIHQIK